MPSVLVYKDVEVEVDVELDDFDTEDLVAELERRNWESRSCSSSEYVAWLTKIHEKRRMGMDYQQELDELIWHALGRIS